MNPAAVYCTKLLAVEPDFDLTCVLCTSWGEVVIGAGAGRVWVGDQRRGFREVSDPGVLDARVECAVELRGGVYLGTHSRLARLVDGTLEPVVADVQGPPSFLTLGVAGGVLWAAGDQFVGRWDRETWSRFEHPDNG